MDQVAIEGLLVLDLRRGRADQGHEAGQDPERVRRAALFHGQAAQIGPERLSALHVLHHGEDAFAIGRREIQAPLRHARLDQHRLAARQVRAASPERLRGLHCFVGLGVPRRPLGVLARAEVAGSDVPGGDHVPGGPAPAQPLDGGELVRQHFRRVVGRRIAGGETYVLGGARQGGDLDHRVERIDRGFAEDTAISLPRAQGVLEEHHVELPAGGDAGDLGVVIDAQQGFGAARRVSPRADVAAADEHPEAQVQLRRRA